MKDQICVPLDDERWVIARVRPTAIDQNEAISAFKASGSTDTATTPMVFLIRQLIESWNITDEDGDRLPLTRENLDARLNLTDYGKIARFITAALEEDKT